MKQLFSGARVFDGTEFGRGPLAVQDGLIVEVPVDPTGWEVVALDGTLAPGFIDLQVNGGGGVMVDGSATPASLRALCEVHARLGATAILPTLITDTFDATARVVQAGIAATKAQVPGFLGLHLEGPHLDPRRKGAHEARLIRQMEGRDLDLILEAASELPALMVTVAPESVNLEQIGVMAAAGVVVSLGHTDCSAEVVQAAIAAAGGSLVAAIEALRGAGRTLVPFDPPELSAIEETVLAENELLDPERPARRFRPHAPCRLCRPRGR